MSCFSCFGSDDDRKARKSASKKDGSMSRKPADGKHKSSSAETKQKQAGNEHINAQAFTFLELAAATKNFQPDSLLGEGGFGRVYKGCFQNTGQVVAIKQLDRNGTEGNTDFLTEVLTLSRLHHENLVNLTGYCADGDQRLLVYDFMPLGCLEDHLLDIPPDQKILSWQTRIKIAYGVAQGLEYLHDKANPPVIYRDLKASNILLDEDFNPKLSDFGLANLSPCGSGTLHFSSMMGTYGYCAPEYARDGEFTLKSDVYSFGVVLLELIAGRRVIDTTRPTNEQNLISWAQPLFRDQKRFPELVDPRLKGDYPVKGLNQAVGVAAMCLQEEPSVRPYIADVVMTLNFLKNAPPEPPGSSSPAAMPTPPCEERAPSDHESSDEESTMDDEEDYDEDGTEEVEEGSVSCSTRSASSCSKGSQHGKESE